ncbi:MAG: pyruvate formate lyase family protein, partial [Bacteroidetes bacterium]|nr:pyruvate formate lyase family protein [Bacteroidota bacterium]
MTERVKRLREQSLAAIPHLIPERALLVAEAYERQGLVSAPLRRAAAFAHIMEHKAICINEGELIVGERGDSPKATYTYPEVCCHSVEDLEILNGRPKVWFRVDENMKKIYHERMIPFWRGKTIREKIFSEMTNEWKECYAAGVFTEFMEQRAPGHTVLDDKIYRRGLMEIREDIEGQLKALDFLNDPEALKKQDELKAMAICADAVMTLARRHAEAAEARARVESDATRKAELEQIARICRHVPANAPRTFWEALQA